MRLLAPLGLGRPGRGASRVHRAWLGFVYAVLLAFVGQACVTQTHVHLDADQVSAPAFATPAVSGGVHLAAPEKAPAQCPICREIAHAGHYLPSVAIVFVAPAPVAAIAAIVPLAGAMRAQRIRPWYSRGPPGALQPR